MPEQHKPATSVINAPQDADAARIEETPRHHDAAPTRPPRDRAGAHRRERLHRSRAAATADELDRHGALRAMPAAARSAAPKRRYTGEPLSLNLKDADIKDVLRTFAQLTGLNIAIDPQRQRFGHRRLRRCAVGSGAGGHPPPELARVRARRKRDARRHGRRASRRKRKRTAAWPSRSG